MLSIPEQASRAMFVSPITRKQLIFDGDALVTEDGLEKYRVADGRAYFIDVHGGSAMSESYERFGGMLSRIRTALQASLPYIIRSRSAERAAAEFERLTATEFVLGIGGGPVRDFAAVNLNIGPWQNVEIVADAHALPYADASVENVSCVAVLEHLNRPDKAVEEIARVLKPGGLVYIETPGLQPYHGYPNHFQNFTITGHDFLMERFGLEKIDSGAATGPTSALTVLIAEYLRQYFPAGSLLANLYRIGLGLPFAQLDRFITRRSNSYVLAGSIFFLGRKPL